MFHCDYILLIRHIIISKEAIKLTPLGLLQQSFILRAVRQLHVQGGAEAGHAEYH